jgi:hypothetical protein
MAYQQRFKLLYDVAMSKRACPPSRFFRGVPASGGRGGTPVHQNNIQSLGAPGALEMMPYALS